MVATVFINGTDESVPYKTSSFWVVATDVSRETSVTAQEAARHLVNNTAINNTITATATHGDTHTRHPWHAGRTVTTRLQEHPMPHSPFLCHSMWDYGELCVKKACVVQTHAF
ncbi:MAG: hypothetical protein IJB27_02085 [Clostridia bacterium]|nr:hypothetical protein [Clostridia bacterium]